MGRFIGGLMLSIALALTLFGGVVSAASDRIPQYDDLSVLRTHVLTIDDLELRGVIPDELADQQRQFYADQASSLRGEPVTVGNLRNWNQFKALFRVQTIVKVLTVIVSLTGALFFLSGVLKEVLKIVSGIVLIILFKIRDFLVAVPLPIYEVIFCTIGACLMVFFRGLMPNFSGAVIFGQSLLVFHNQKTWDSLQENFEVDVGFVSGVCCLTYAGAAWWSQSTILGVLASLAFVTFFGFKLVAGPLTLVIGFDRADKVGQGTFAAGCLTIFGVVLTQNYLPHSIEIFETGALFTGTFVYFSGMVILSSKWLADHQYWLRNSITFFSGPALIWLSTSLELGVVNAIAGTFFVIFLINKYVEFCTLWVRNSITLGAALLGAGLVGLGLIRIVERYPQYFIFNLNELGL